MEEKSYDRVELAREVDILKPKLNTCQRRIYDRVIHDATEGHQSLIFVYSHGGTEKTFLWKVLINALRSEGKIVLVVASSGIASLLLPAGRTTHSRFKLPLDLYDDSILVLGGDFRQTFPVKKGGSKAEIISASIAESHLWKHFQVYTLTENMRLQQPTMNDNQRLLASYFATWLLDVGNGKIRTPEYNNDPGISRITIPEQYCIPNTEDGM
ncbi:DNA helicase [Tanacetum coccineum]